MAIWTNNDGLRVKMGVLDEAVKGQGGAYSYPHGGGSHITEIVIDYTDLATGAAVVDDHVLLPVGAFIEEVEIVCITAATSGGSATLNLGLQRLDRSTEHDYDGLAAAVALATIDTTGETNRLVKGGTGAGALIGTVLTNAGVITADWDTAAFTAGKWRARIKWSAVPTVNS